MTAYSKFTVDRDEIIGDTKHIHEFYSVYLKNERDIIVWFPPSYLATHKNYPVLYVQDGQNIFNPRTSFIGYDWKMDEVSTVLMENRLVDEFIIVAIYNTKDRLDEYNYFTPKGKSYSKFLTKELKPFIDENFRTLTNYKNTALIGSSMGGLISFQLFWNFPQVFGKAACLSNSFWVNNGEIFKMVEVNPSVRKNAKLYIDCGDLETELLDDFKKMCTTLKSIGYESGKNLECHLQHGAKHSEYDWAARLHIPLKFLFGTGRDL